MLGLTALLIPIAGIVACFGTPVLIVLLYFVFRNKRRRENLALAREFLNKGIPVPPQLLDESLKYAQVASAVASVRPQQRSDLRKGIKLVSIGLAVGVVFYVFWPHSTTWAWGLLPVIVGAGFILSGSLENKAGGKDETLPPSPGSGPAL